MCETSMKYSPDFLKRLTNHTRINLEEWDVAHMLNLEQEYTPDYGIIVLNRPISHNQIYLVHLWKNAKVTLTTDGGTERWDTFLQDLDEETRFSLKPPDLVTGDFDSIKTSTLEKYRSLGSKVGNLLFDTSKNPPVLVQCEEELTNKLRKSQCLIVHTPDQDATDFTKAVIEMSTYCHERQISLESIIVISETSGRMDHIMASINTLFVCQQELLEYTKVFLMSSDSVSWLLRDGEHVLNIPERLRVEESWCAMIPVGQECSNVTTTGLKWNLENKLMKFGALVSTSNTYDGSPAVEIKCSQRLLWSMSIEPLLSDSFLIAACSEEE